MYYDLRKLYQTPEHVGKLLISSIKRVQFPSKVPLKEKIWCMDFTPVIYIDNGIIWIFRCQKRTVKLYSAFWNKPPRINMSPTINHSSNKYVTYAYIRGVYCSIDLEALPCPTSKVSHFLAFVIPLFFSSYHFFFPFYLSAHNGLEIIPSHRKLYTSLAYIISYTLTVCMLKVHYCRFGLVTGADPSRRWPSLAWTRGTSSSTTSPTKQSRRSHNQSINTKLKIARTDLPFISREYSKQD